MLQRLSDALYGMRGRQDLALILILLTAVVVMIIPMPTLMLDVLIALNITLTMLILMVALYIDRPTSFSTFPAVILIATTFRLAISVSTTRTILTEADGGAIVETFGNFVTGGNLVVGLVIFMIITIVQFVVITKGAERVAEVSARFVLDALPGRQMSIDAELRAGDIDPLEARARRRILDKENQFFGAMDGAMKFVKGDAIAGLLIVVVNLVGGIAIGAAQKGMSLGQATTTYSLLTIGDGLVAQIPALLLALCSGAIVTRVTSDQTTDLGGDIAAELVGSRRSIAVAGVVVSAFGLVPGFPTVLFLAFGGGLLWFAYAMPAPAPKAKGGGASARAGTEPASVPTAASAEPQSGDRLVAVVAADLAAEVDKAAFAAFRDRARSRGEEGIGVALPRFGLEIAEDAAPGTVRLEFDRVALFADRFGPDEAVAEGDPAVLDAAGLPRRPLARHWRRLFAHRIPNAEAARLAEAGLRQVSLAELLADAGVEHLKANASSLVGFEEAHALLGQLRALQPRLADQVSSSVPTTRLVEVLRRLVAEQVPLAPLQSLFESLAEWGQRETDAAVLAEHVRRALRRQICNGLADQHRTIPAYVVEPDLEQMLRDAVRLTDSGAYLMMSSRLSNILLAQVEAIAMPDDPAARLPVLAAAADLRRHLAQYLRSHGVMFPVISHQEVSPEFQLHPVGALSATAPPELEAA